MTDQNTEVILHVYRLSTPEGQWVVSLLPSIGMGAFHTSLEYQGSRYTFAAHSGIIRTSSRSEGVPTGATFQESIRLGKTANQRGQVKKILTKMGDLFGPDCYHLVHRNCNHFTETLATALILSDDDRLQKKSSRLSTYPAWVNRLAKTSQSIVSHDPAIVPCDPWSEARSIMGITEESVKREKKLKKTRAEKKQLTDEQKAVLRKIRAGK